MLDDKGMFPSHGCSIVMPKIQAQKVAAACNHPALSRAIDAWLDDLAKRIVQAQNET